MSNSIPLCLVNVNYKSATNSQWYEEWNAELIIVWPHDQFEGNKARFTIEVPSRKVQFESKMLENFG